MSALWVMVHKNGTLFFKASFTRAIAQKKQIRSTTQNGKYTVTILYAHRHKNLLIRLWLRMRF